MLLTKRNGCDIIDFVVEVWLSLVEYFVRDEGAAGSNPVTSTSVKTLENALRTAFSRVFLMLFKGFI